MSANQPELIIEWEDEDKHPPDPLADLKLYFAKVELMRQERIREQRSNSKNLSIYEQSRIRRPR